MKLVALSLATLAATLISTTLAVSAQAAPHSSARIELIHRLENQAAEFRKEIDAHYKHSGAYKHLVTDSNSIYRQVQHLDEIIHDRAKSSHVRADLAKVDEAIEHIHEVLDDVENGTYGHTHGSTDHVHDLVNAMSSTVDRLRSSFGESSYSHSHGGSRSYGSREHRDYGDRDSDHGHNH